MLIATLSLLACKDGGQDTNDTTPAAEECPEPDTGYVPVTDGSALMDRRPVVIRTIPQGGDQAVDPGRTEIHVWFSKDMQTDRYSWIETWEGHYPDSSDVWFESPREAVLEVTLEPDTSYELGVNSGTFDNFRDTTNRPAVPYQFAFHTAPE